MPFKSDKQRRWMWANEPEMAERWSDKEKSESNCGIDESNCGIDEDWEGGDNLVHPIDYAEIASGHKPHRGIEILKISESRIKAIIREEVSFHLTKESVEYFFDDDGEENTLTDVDFDWGKYPENKEMSNDIYYSESQDTLGSVQRSGDPFTYEKEGGSYVIVSAPETHRDSIGDYVGLPADVVQMVRDSANEFKDKYKPGTQLAENTIRVIADNLAASARIHRSSTDGIVRQVEKIYRDNWSIIENLLDTIPISVSITNYEDPEHPADVMARVMVGGSRPQPGLEISGFVVSHSGPITSWDDSVDNPGIEFNLAYDWSTESKYKKSGDGSSRAATVEHELGHIWQQILYMVFGIDIDFFQAEEFEEQGRDPTSDDWEDNTWDWMAEIHRFRDEIRRKSGGSPMRDPFDENVVHALCFFGSLFEYDYPVENGKLKLPQYCVPARLDGDGMEIPDSVEYSCRSLNSISLVRDIWDIQDEDIREWWIEWMYKVIEHAATFYLADTGFDVNAEEVSKWWWDWLGEASSGTPIDHRVLRKISDGGCDDVMDLVGSFNRTAFTSEDTSWLEDSDDE